MSLFAYRAINERSAAVEGTITADSLRAARDLLRGQGLIVETVTTQRERSHAAWWPFRRRRRFAAKRVEAIRELSTLLATNHPKPPVATAARFPIRVNQHDPRRRRGRRSEAGGEGTESYGQRPFLP
jgi:hypothetical protein